jgi:hypothetical protein
MGAEIITIEKPAPPAIVAELSPIVAVARAFEVTDVETDRIAQERGRHCRLGEKGIEDHFAKTKRALIDAKKAFDSSIAALTGPIAEARAIYFQKSDAFQAAERTKAEEESRRLQAIARKEEQERQLLSAIEAEASGDTLAAEAILQEEVVPPLVTVVPSIAKVEGVSSMTRWSAEVYDKLALDRYVAAHPEWSSLTEPSLPNLNRLAVAQRQALSIPGVRAVSKIVRTTR